MHIYTTLAARALLTNDLLSSDVVTIIAHGFRTRVVLTVFELAAYRNLYNPGDHAIYQTSALVSEDAVMNLVVTLRSGNLLCLDDARVASEHPYNETELIEIFECARLALADGDNFDSIVESCDLSDEYLRGLRDKLNAFMDSLKG